MRIHRWFLILALLLGAAALIYNAARIVNGEQGLGGGLAAALETWRPMRHLM